MKKVIPILTAIPTKQEVVASVNKNLTIIKDEIEAVFSKLHPTLNQLVSMDAPVEVKNQWLVDVIANISKVLDKVVPCGSGCSHCCNMAVSISKWDADRIGKAIGVNPVKLPPATLDSLEQAEANILGKYIGVKCPFLVDDKCSVYEVRPISCRTNFNLSDYPILCDVVNHSGSDVPAIDMTLIWAAATQINFEPHPIFGDIREFFPEKEYK